MYLHQKHTELQVTGWLSERQHSDRQPRWHDYNTCVSLADWTLLSWTATKRNHPILIKNLKNVSRIQRNIKM